MSRIIPNPPPAWDSWEDIMQLALKEAEKALALDEVPVGAIVINAEGKILSKAHNQCLSLNDPTAHAEVLALRKAGIALKNYRLNKCYMLLTLEPCLMCAGAIVHARLAGLIFGAYDDKTGAIASCHDAFDLPFHNSNPWHMGGILQDESMSLLQKFFKNKRKVTYEDISTQKK